MLSFFSILVIYLGVNVSALWCAWFSICRQPKLIRHLFVRISISAHSCMVDDKTGYDRTKAGRIKSAQKKPKKKQNSHIRKCLQVIWRSACLNEWERKKVSALDCSETEIHTVDQLWVNLKDDTRYHCTIYIAKTHNKDQTVDNFSTSFRFYLVHFVSSVLIHNSDDFYTSSGGKIFQQFHAYIWKCYEHTNMV